MAGFHLLALFLLLPEENIFILIRIAVKFGQKMKRIIQLKADIVFILKTNPLPSLFSPSMTYVMATALPILVCREAALSKKCVT